MAELSHDSDTGACEPLLDNDSAEYSIRNLEDVELRGSRCNAYNGGRRLRKDSIWAVLFALVMIAAVGCGIYAICGHNPDWRNLLSTSSLDDSSNCPSLSEDSPTSHPLHPNNFRLPDILGSGSHPHMHLTSEMVRQILAAPILISIAGSLALGVAYILCLRKAPKLSVAVTAGCVVLFPVLLSLANYSTFHWFRFKYVGEDVQRVGVAAMAIPLALYVAVNRRHLEATSKLLSICAQIVDKNLSLFFIIPVLNIFLIALWVFTLTSFIFAQLNGRLVANSHSATCGRNGIVHCCRWQKEEWVVWFDLLALASLFWATRLIVMLLTFVISGAVAQWYWAPLGGPKPSPYRSLRHGLGSSFGTLCVATSLLPTFEAVSGMCGSCCGSERRRWHPTPYGPIGIPAPVVRMCGADVAVLESSIFGTSFHKSQRNLSDRFHRHGLKPAPIDKWGVWVMSAGSGIMALGWGAAVGWGMAMWCSEGGGHGLSEDNILMVACIEGLIAFCLVRVWLRPFRKVMITTIESLYVCHAVDRDLHLITRPHMYELYKEVAELKFGRTPSTMQAHVHQMEL